MVLYNVYKWTRYARLFLGISSEYFYSNFMVRNMDLRRWMQDSSTSNHLQLTFLPSPKAIQDQPGCHSTVSSTATQNAEAETLEMDKDQEDEKEEDTLLRFVFMVFIHLKCLSIRVPQDKSAASGWVGLPFLGPFLHWRQRRFHTGNHVPRQRKAVGQNDV